MLKKRIAILFVFATMIFGAVFGMNVLINYSYIAKATTADHNVEGWAWSENVGWISFNSSGCDKDGDGRVDASGVPAGCPPASTVISNYGVNIAADGTMSGYAWSDNIGWIHFAPVGPFPAAPNYSAKLDTATGQISGWARALANGGGWDGWVNMSGTNHSVTIDVAGDFHGWAWGSTVLGWISFNCDGTSVCGDSNYKVFTGGVNLGNPTVEGMSATLRDLCESPSAQFSWTYRDDTDSEDKFDIQIDNNSDFSSPNVNRANIDVAVMGTVTPNSQLVSVSNNAADRTCTGCDRLGYNTVYYWRVRVWDTTGANSGWANGSGTLATPLHMYPTADFTWVPSGPAAGEEVDFVDQSATFGGSSKQSWRWDFTDGTPAVSNVQNPDNIQFRSEGTKAVIFSITDSDGYRCSEVKDVGVKYPLPDWTEKGKKR